MRSGTLPSATRFASRTLRSTRVLKWTEVIPRSRGNEIVNEAVRDLGGQLVKGMVVEGPPAERIAELAEADGYDLVVVGSRGRNAVARLFLGSVADRLVHICKKPVLVSR